MGNYSSLVAIVTGLHTDLANRAMRKSWMRVPQKQIRVLRDLKKYCTSEEDFHFIGTSVAAVVNLKFPSNGENASVISVGGTDSSKGGQIKSEATTCIPFIGEGCEYEVAKKCLTFPCSRHVSSAVVSSLEIGRMR